MERRCTPVTSLLKGLDFVRGYLPQLSADFAQTFGPDCFDIEDEWSNYQQLADLMIRHLLGQQGPKPDRGVFGRR